MSDTLIHIEALSYYYPRASHPALKDVSLTVWRGDFVGLIGPTGAGKTTLCLALSGLIPQALGGRFFGHVRVAGLDTVTTPMATLARHVGMVFEDPEMQLVATTVEGEVAFALENLALPRAVIRARVERVLSLVGLQGLERRSPQSLSGGQKQRLAIAVALALEPPVLVLDEPTAQLDPQGAEEVFAALRALHQRGMTIIVASHAAEALASSAQRLVLLDEGRVVTVDTPAALYGMPERVHTHRLRAPQVAEVYAALGWRPAPVCWTEALPRPLRVSSVAGGLNVAVQAGWPHEAGALLAAPTPDNGAAPSAGFSDARRPLSPEIENEELHGAGALLAAPTPDNGAALSAGLSNARRPLSPEIENEEFHGAGALLAAPTPDNGAALSAGLPNARRPLSPEVENEEFHGAGALLAAPTPDNGAAPSVGLSNARRPLSSPLLELNEVDYGYPNGTVALRGVNLAVRRGEFVALLGANGAGKTTLVRLIMRLLSPTRGEVRWEGTPTTTWTVSEMARRIGYVAQQPERQLFGLSVEEEIAFALRYAGLSAQECAARVEEALVRFGLERVRMAHPLVLPRGERARVVLAAMVALRPQVLMLDEPTVGQDEAGARAILEAVRALHAEGMTVVLITHHLHLLPGYATRAVVLRAGQVALDGPLPAVLGDEVALRACGLYPPQVVAMARAWGMAALTPQELVAALDGRAG